MRQKLKNSTGSTLFAADAEVHAGLLLRRRSKVTFPNICVR
jgi:hypothetical protein